MDEEKALAKGLVVLATTQQKIGAVFPGWSEGNPEYVRTTFLALYSELGELLQKFPWRQWRTPGPVDREGMAEEFADVLAFLGYVVHFCQVYGQLTPYQLAEAYSKKTTVNKDRLSGKVGGFVGVSATTNRDGETPLPSPFQGDLKEY